MKLLAVIGISAVLALSGCKNRSESRLKDGDIRDEEGSIFVLGARKGMVMFRKCSREEQIKWTARAAQDAFLEDCTNPASHPDIPVADYHRLLCDSYRFDRAELDRATQSRDGAAKLYEIWRRKAEAIQAKINGQSGGAQQDITVFGDQQQTGGESVDDLRKQLTPTLEQQNAQKKIMDEAQAKIDQHNTAKSNCDRLMTEVVLPKKDPQDPNLEIPTSVPLYPQSPEYPHLMAPFLKWSGPNQNANNQNQGQSQQQGQNQGNQSNQSNQSGQSEPKEFEHEFKIDSITGQYSHQCTVSYLNGPSYSSDSWKAWFEKACTNACVKRNHASCATWSHHSAIIRDGVCHGTLKIRCN